MAWRKILGFNYSTDEKATEAFGDGWSMCELNHTLRGHLQTAQAVAIKGELIALCAPVELWVQERCLGQATALADRLGFGSTVLRTKDTFAHIRFSPYSVRRN